MQQETEYQPMTGCPQRLHELVTMEMAVEMEMDPCGLQAKVFSLHIAGARQKTATKRWLRGPSH